VCGITSGGARRVVCWGDSRDIARVPDDLVPAGIRELTGGGGGGGARAARSEL